MEKIKVLTHTGYFINNPIKKDINFLFITVKNISNKDVWILNIFIDVKEKGLIQILNEERITPCLLHKGNTWETWISLPIDNIKREDLYTGIIVISRQYKSSKHYTTRSSKDFHVTSIGLVPDGTY